MTDALKKMIEQFEDKCEASGHAWAKSPLGGEYCQACGADRKAQSE